MTTEQCSAINLLIQELASGIGHLKPIMRNEKHFTQQEIIELCKKIVKLAEENNAEL